MSRPEGREQTYQQQPHRDSCDSNEAGAPPLSQCERGEICHVWAGSEFDDKGDPKKCRRDAKVEIPRETSGMADWSPS